MKTEKKIKLTKVLDILSWVVLSLVVIAFIFPVFVCRQFRIGGESMTPTLTEGDHIMVNKLLMGARIYTKYDFEDPDMACFRMYGFRKIKQGDVAVFNFPFGRGQEKIEFKINYVYAKRCIGCPGDSVSIENGYYRNSNCKGRILGNELLQHHLSETPDSILLRQNVYLPAFPYDYRFGWTISNFGPLYVPRRGDVIELNAMSVKLYELQIEFETGIKPVMDGTVVLLDGRPVSEYRFKSNWYFFGGDNIMNSKDSRYVGLVPEDYIIGVATRLIWRNGRLCFERI